MKLSLKENAYDFLHNSLYFYHLATGEDYPDDYKRYWRFSLVELVQSMELLFKEVLRRENEVFIYDNIDKPKNTVSVTKALERMKNIIKIDLSNSEETVIRKAIDLRNQILHFEIELDVQELSTIYAILFEFLHNFHLNFLHEELHCNIHSDYWEEEALLIEQFRQEFVFYNGAKISNKFAIEIVESQMFPTYTIKGTEYKRIKFGEELSNDPRWFDSLTYCGDCAVEKGYFHAMGCDTELCPKCMQQAISCDCEYEYTGDI
ncbi:hypothetical protein FH966_06900 [Lentibacillus cibarius]|uniref:Uncharacterized protein n=1 Tax=Lentibacillus cibarius TaxID=2583219 RepID=A0A549YHU1_9BACI|nr:hypothetical protein [Lentibacillus cibarius]TRM11446.1 hypothetical protein FH966_06900 [Lentibacillus cibarius]